MFEFVKHQIVSAGKYFSHTPEVKPKEFEEQTGPQGAKSGLAGVMPGAKTGAAAKRGRVRGQLSSIAIGKPAAGTFQLYRKMRGNPTIALARTVATAPIKMANWAIEADDGVPEDRTAFIKRQMKALMPDLKRDMLWALDFGFSSFEKVFEIRDGLIGIDMMKNLRPDKVTLLADMDTGRFAGLKQGTVELSEDKSFLYTHDGEPGDLYGRSRHENIRRSAWHPWWEISDKQLKYVTKVAGVIPIIEYPEGQSRDKDGSLEDNFDLAEIVLDDLGRGQGVAMPNVFAAYAGDLAKQGVDLSQLMAWRISFLETKQQHGKEFTEMMRHRESLMLRGWMVPERAAVEGQFGTKAEAGTHGDLALVVSELVWQDMIIEINKQIIDLLLFLNWGQEAVGTVRVIKEGLDPLTQSFFREIVKEVLTNPSNIDIFLKSVSLDAVLDATDLPKMSENIVIDRAPGSDHDIEGPRGEMAATLQAVWSGAGAKGNGQKIIV